MSRWTATGRCPDDARRNGGCVAITCTFALQAHVGRGVPLRVGQVEATGPIDAGRTGTHANRRHACDNVYAPRGQTGREHVLSLFVGVRPERSAVVV